VRDRVKDLTPAYINRLLPFPGAKHDRAVRDPLRPGLYLAVQASGVKLWSVRYRNRDGRTRKYTIGRWPDVSISTAREQARKILEAAAEGRDPQEQKLRQRRGSHVQNGDGITKLEHARLAIALRTQVHGIPRGGGSSFPSKAIAKFRFSVLASETAILIAFISSLLPPSPAGLQF
jgi:hypothetical protein